MPEERPRPITLGVAGGSGSGKTTVARRIQERIGEDAIAYLPQDSYYRDLSELPREQRNWKFRGVRKCRRRVHELRRNHHVLVPFAC